MKTLRECLEELKAKLARMPGVCGTKWHRERVAEIARLDRRIAALAAEYGGDRKE